MNKTYPQIKQMLKIERWQLRRITVRRKYGKAALQSAPIIFGNAMPKAGSHLLSQVLRGMQNLGPFVNTGFPSVNRDVTNSNLPDELVLKNIQRLQPGDIGFGKLVARPPFIDALTQPNMATIFIYRDPRDLLVSVIRYATDMHLGHGLHDHFTTVLKTDEERLRFVIAGSDNPEVPYLPIITRYQGYLGWFDQPVLAIKFEDLVDDRRKTLDRILDHISEKGYRPDIPREAAVDVLEKAVQPHKSGTFRKGTAGQWRSLFTPELKNLFKETTGDLLQKLGYEQDADW